MLKFIKDRDYHNLEVVVTKLMENASEARRVQWRGDFHPNDFLVRAPLYSDAASLLAVCDGHSAARAAVSDILS